MDCVISWIIFAVLGWAGFFKMLFVVAQEDEKRREERRRSWEEEGQ